MCLLRISLPNLCPTLNNFDAVDFSECHSEEVISYLDAQCSYFAVVYINDLSLTLKFSFE